ncbi:MAG: C4-type zinc ribbon domain-containing protein [Ilumatobacter sp.]|uniref:zinc ribbon domain-containing protein n=1 Tax=Ilumatobacter sp. TaxID=1967498 RepID=UPI003299FEE5
MTDSSDAPDQTPITTADRLLEVQRIDTEADQLANRRERLVERDQLHAASTSLTTWERERNSMRSRLDDLTAVIERAESDAAGIDAHRVRLAAQLKTVIAPREAEALMHEMATLDEQVDALDTVELEALEEQSDVDDRLTAHLSTESALRDAVSVADSALERATAEIDRELDELSAQRSVARGELADGVMARYDRVRASSGVAVAKLVGHRCDGCHLDLSAAEVDVVKEEAAVSDGVADCPNCGRMLAL